MNATRITDGKQVALKRIITARYPNEVQLARLFCSETHVSDASNHSVPIYDVLDIPDLEGIVLLIMPLLAKCLPPDFDTVGEFVAFVEQIFGVSAVLH